MPLKKSEINYEKIPKIRSKIELITTILEQFDSPDMDAHTNSPAVNRDLFKKSVEINTAIVNDLMDLIVETYGCVALDDWIGNNLIATGGCDGCNDSLAVEWA